MGVRGPRAKPINLKILEGNPGHQRLPETPNFGDIGLPPPPNHLDAEARAEWLRLAPELHNLNLLKSVDTVAFATYCVTYSVWKNAVSQLAALADVGAPYGGLIVEGPKGQSIANPLIAIAHSSSLALLRFAAEFGMTPAARARVTVDAAVASNERWKGLLKGAA